MITSRGSSAKTGNIQASIFTPISCNNNNNTNNSDSDSDNDNDNDEEFMTDFFTRRSQNISDVSSYLELVMSHGI